MELLHFDIETASNYKDFETFRLNDVRGSNLFQKKYDKMNWDKKYESIDDAYLQQGGIITTYGRIVCISFGFFLDNGDKKIRSYYGDDEKDIVNSFNDILKRVEKKDFNLAGFRILHFDIIYILHKLHKYDIKPANIISIYDKKPWDMRVTDMSDDFRGKFAWSYSFDEMCYELGVDSPKTNMDGSQVNDYYWGGKCEEVKDYCELDVSASMDVEKVLYN